MASSDKVRIVLHEEGQNQHADVHSVVIGIGCDYYVVVAKVFKILFYAEC